MEDTLNLKIETQGDLNEKNELPHKISDEKLPPAPKMRAGSYKEARGILNWQDGDEPAEVSIRRMRDGE